jgi:ribonuclease Y
VKVEENAEKDILKAQEKLDKIEERLLQKEEKLDEKKEQLEQEKSKIAEKYKEVEDTIVQQTEILSQIAKLTQEEAKEELLTIIKTTEEKEIREFVDKYRSIKKEEADKEAMQIIARVMPRIAAESVGEFTSELVDIPDESFKGKLIGRE